MPNNKEKISQDIAIIAAILNIIILPGLGTIIAKRTGEGIAQLSLFVIGIVLSVVLIGFPILLAVWIWALITSIDILKNAEDNRKNTSYKDNLK